MARRKIKSRAIHGARTSAINKPELAADPSG
jgi:hypothetical protein